MINREIEYYIKNLPLIVRQEIFRRLDDVNPRRVEELLEKDKDYISFRNKGFSNEQIKELLEQSSERFKKVNDIMIENERYPLFDNVNDTYKSSLQYVNILKKREEKELIEKFGCTWEEYKPLIYKKKSDEFERVD